MFLISYYQVFFFMYFFSFYRFFLLLSCFLFCSPLGLDWINWLLASPLPVPSMDLKIWGLLPHHAKQSPRYRKVNYLKKKRTSALISSTNYTSGKVEEVCDNWKKINENYIIMFLKITSLNESRWNPLISEIVSSLSRKFIVTKNGNQTK